MQRVVLSSPWPGELLVGVGILWQLAGWLAGELAGWLLGLADWQSVCVACGEGFCGFRAAFTYLHILDPAAIALSPAPGRLAVPPGTWGLHSSFLCKALCVMRRAWAGHRGASLALQAWLMLRIPAQLKV